MVEEGDVVEESEEEPSSVGDVDVPWSEGVHVCVCVCMCMCVCVYDIVCMCARMYVL